MKELKQTLLLPIETFTSIPFLSLFSFPFFPIFYVPLPWTLTDIRQLTDNSQGLQRYILEGKSVLSAADMRWLQWFQDRGMKTNLSQSFQAQIL